MFSNMRYIYEVYKESSFSKAAQNLYISQPSLSAVVKKTEKKVGMPLFDRSTTPIQLTEAGEEYIKVAERIMDLQEGFSNYVGNLHELKTGKIAIGGTYLYSVFVLPSAIYRFHEQYPNVKIQVFEGHTDQLEEELFSGEIDLMLDNYSMDPNIYGKSFLMKETLLFAVPKAFSVNERLKGRGLSAQDILNGKHRNPNTPGISIREFGDDPFVVLRTHNDTRARLEKICKKADFTPNIALKLDQMMMTYRLTEQGHGISFISDSVVKSQNVTNNIIYYKIDDSEAERDVNFYYKKSKYFTKAMEKFIEMCLLMNKDML